MSRVKELMLCIHCASEQLKKCQSKRCKYFKICVVFQQEKGFPPSWLFYKNKYYGDNPERMWSDER